MPARRTQPRLTREASQAQTRERLLEAAKGVFANGGYGGASVDQIAAEAGFSKGAFYSNFDSKEAIFLELLARHKAREAEELNTIVGEDVTPASTMTALERWLDALNIDGDWSLLAVELELHAQRSPAFAAAYRKLHAEHQEQLSGVLTRLFQRAGKALPAKASDLAAAMTALAHGLALQQIHGARVGKLIKVVLQSLITAAPRR